MVAKNPTDAATLVRVKKEVAELAGKFPVPGIG